MKNRKVHEFKALERKPSERLYLAYGSNLNMRDMKYRCPGAKPLGVIVLDNAKLVFRGVADVTCEYGFQVPCGLWRVTESDELALDRYEGYGRGFYDKDELDIGRGRMAFIYTMTATGIFPPSQHYADCIRQGYRDFGIPMGYLNEAIKRSYDDKNPCEQTRARRLRQKNDSRQLKLVKMPTELMITKADRLRKNGGNQ